MQFVRSSDEWSLDEILAQAHAHTCVLAGTHAHVHAHAEPAAAGVAPRARVWHPNPDRCQRPHRLKRSASAGCVNYVVAAAVLVLAASLDPKGTLLWGLCLWGGCKSRGVLCCVVLWCWPYDSRYARVGTAISGASFPQSKRDSSQPGPVVVC